MANKDIIQDTRRGDVITAEKQTRITRAINANTQAHKRPTQKDIPTGGLGGQELGDEVFNTTSSTEETITATDSNGDTTSVQRFTQIVLTETTSGRKMTLNLSYP